ncbi:2-oxo acid dehydrogenase subunit E2 [Candidatus Poribacteria bacterium]|nr:2-oxo acid dehydrogenase subunit E2 [Candidatus Poribacteria bacterium]
MYQFKLPDLGEGIAEAEVAAWLVKEGDVIAADQLIAEIMTDKAVMEIPSPRAGRVRQLCVKEGNTVPVGQPLIEIDDSEVFSAAPGAPRTGEDTAEIVPESQAPVAEVKAPMVPAPPAREPSATPKALEEKHPPRLPPRPHAHPASAHPERRKPVDAVPAVRELAKQLGVDIEQVHGTGPEGRVMRRDVEAFYETLKKAEPQIPPAPLSKGGIEGGFRFTRPAAPSVLPEAPVQPDEPDWTRQPLRRLRRRIAEQMVRSKTLIPHYTYVEEIDMTLVEEKRTALAETTGGEKISPLAFIAHAIVRILPHYPQMNSCMDEQTQEIIYKGKIHLGIAVATEAGLVVPVIRDATERNVAELAAAIRDLSDRARKKKLNLSELKGSTITMTSLGKLGGVMATPIINYPASAIIGVHAIRTLPRYVDDQVQPRKIMNLSISLDHRIVDGFEAAQFIQDVKEILEQADFPEFK